MRDTGGGGGTLPPRLSSRSRRRRIPPASTGPSVEGSAGPVRRTPASGFSGSAIPRQRRREYSTERQALHFRLALARAIDGSALPALAPPTVQFCFSDLSRQFFRSRMSLRCRRTPRHGGGRAWPPGASPHRRIDTGKVRIMKVRRRPLDLRLPGLHRFPPFSKGIGTNPKLS